MAQPSAASITARGLGSAIHHSAILTRKGLLERLFTRAFRGLVYPQIWEDPAVDMAALQLGGNDHVVAIASGGCNVMNYLTAGPGHITAVDLNGAHVALTKLKLAAARHLEDHATFYRFFGQAAATENVATYFSRLRPHLDDDARHYWDSRTLQGQRRIAMFAKGFYRFGLLGRFLGAIHAIARLHGTNPKVLLTARSRAEQRILFERHLAPMFEKPLIRWLLRQPISLYGLGIPPKQYGALAADGTGGIVTVIKSRLEKLACDFDLKDNYFAWQAFGRAYTQHVLPTYLQPASFAAIKANADRVDVRHQSVTHFLRACVAASVDAYVLLDAQDWMNDADLADLWSEVTRTARPGARVIFRTAADERLLPGRIPDELLGQWVYDSVRSRTGTDQDRSAIYGGFHLYVKRDQAR